MKPIVIAGNGPSLKEIDYRRLPKEYDVFRCTQFFFEDKYYLGKEVTGFFMGEDVFPSLFNTAIILESLQEYFFENKYFSGVILDDKIDLKMFLKDFWTAQAAFDIYTKHKQISQFINNHLVSHGVYPTTGNIMIFTAIALGYTEIYVTGIDFYDTKTELYAFDLDSSNTLKNKVKFENPFSNSKSWHNEEYDKKGVELVKILEGINIYSITPDSKLSTLLPLAPIQNDTPYIPTPKPENYLKDIILTEQDRRAQKGIKQKIKNIFIKKDLKNEWEFMRQNSLVRFIYQTIKLPYIMMKIIIKLIK